MPLNDERRAALEYPKEGWTKTIVRGATRGLLPLAVSFLCLGAAGSQTRIEESTTTRVALAKHFTGTRYEKIAADSNASVGAHKIASPDPEQVRTQKKQTSAQFPEYPAASLPACGASNDHEIIVLADGPAEGEFVRCDGRTAVWRCLADNPRQGIIDPECPPYGGSHHFSSSGGSANDTAIPATWERWKDLNENADRACIVLNGSFAINAPLEIISKRRDPHGAFTSPFPCLKGPETNEGGLLTGNDWGSATDLVHFAANEGKSNLNNFNIHHLRLRGSPANSKPSNCLLRLSKAYQGRISNLILESVYHCGLGFSVGGGHVSIENILIRQEGIKAADMSATGRFLRIGGNDIDVTDIQCEATTADTPMDMMHVFRARQVRVSHVGCTEEGVDAGIFFEPGNDTDCQACDFSDINLTTRGNGWEFRYRERSGNKSLDLPGWTLRNASFTASTEATAPHDYCFRTSEGTNNRVYDLFCDAYDTGFRADSEDNLIARDVTLKRVTTGFQVSSPTGNRIGPAEIDASGIAFDCSGPGTDGGNNVFGPFTFTSTPATYFRTDNCHAATTTFAFADQIQQETPSGAARCGDNGTGSTPGEFADLIPYYKTVNVTIGDPDGCNLDYSDDGTKLGNGMEHQVCLVGYSGSGAGTLNIGDETNVTDVKATVSLSLGQCARFRRDQTHTGLWTDL